MSSDNSNFNNLLVIDDNEAIHDDLRKIFTPIEEDVELEKLDEELFGTVPRHKNRSWTYNLAFASQGKQGLDILTQARESNQHFGAAFVDMRMPPGWDGVETIKRLWEVDPDLQVVICTAYSDHSWDEITYKLGLTDQLLILRKPFDEIEVVQLAASLSAKRKLLAENRERMEHLEAVVVDQGSELKAAHEDAEHLIASISSMLISIDDHGDVSRWNPVATNLFGIPELKAVGRKFTDLPIQWNDRDALAASIRNCVVVKQQQLEFQFVDNSGLLRTLDMMICPILNDASSTSRLLLASDVTLQKALQIQLDQAQRLESVGQLAAGVAHEINTPMQYIGDNVRYVAKSFEQMAPIFDCLPILADPNISEEKLAEIRNSFPETFKLNKVCKSLKQIPEALIDSIDGVEAVSKIVAAMKEFSHPGTDQKIQTCVNHILQSTITVAKNEWKYVADVDTDFELDLTTIGCLRSELNQAFLNIVVNAAHAIGDRVANDDFAKGLIKIRTHSTNDFVQVDISDNGGGIPANIQNRIFQPFFTTKEVGRGTGQGLAIAHAVIVQKHKGKLWIDVENGVGTTFHIQLPRHTEENSETPDTPLTIDSQMGARS